jgi:hypothetical protein
VQRTWPLGSPSRARPRSRAALRLRRHSVDMAEVSAELDVVEKVRAARRRTKRPASLNRSVDNSLNRSVDNSTGICGPAHYKLRQEEGLGWQLR